MNLNEAQEAYYRVGRVLAKKWKPLLNEIKGEYNVMTTAILLENQQQYGGELNRLDEFTGSPTAAVGAGAGSTVGAFQHYLLPLVRRVYPNLITNELVGVQP